MLHHLDLNGTWKVRWADGQRGRGQYAERDETDPDRYIDAVVPGEIHLDAWRAGWLADPYVGTNCLAARWVEECLWSYRREFEAPAAALAAKHVWLNFGGLDLVATVVLNGQEVGRHRNAFYPCRVEVSGRLRPGRNILAVHLDSGLFDAAEKPVEGYGVSPDARLHKRHWQRKPQCQFGWDWSTRLVNLGITGPVCLEWTDDPLRADQFVVRADLTADLACGTVCARWFVEGLTDGDCEAELTVAVPEAGVRVVVPVTVRPGLTPCEATLNVDQPALWWPAGQGAQARYRVSASLQCHGAAIATRETHVGFRHVRINQDPHPAGGRYFNLEINGRKVFVKGGNLVPADMIFARLDRERYDTLTHRALEANFNMLRVWGGGLYEADAFYDLCDERGLLVWQEFIFACAKYPATDLSFVEEVQREAVFHIRRLASHPSLVVWCGNNEMEWGAWQWGYDRQTPVLPDYALFHLVLPRLLAQEDPGRYYQPSSPWSPDGQLPNADALGDQHPWSIGFVDTDFRKYRTMTCRFPNEGGILGPTALPTVLACLPEGQRRVQSFAWQVHDNAIDSWAEPSPPDQMLRQWLGKDIRNLDLEEYTYWAGLVQGEGLREYCENFRRRMFDTAAAIFWMYNDTWPATRSWTIVDYYLRRTPAFWAVRRAMQPVHVVVAFEDDQISVFGVNDTPAVVEAALTWGVFTLAGSYPRRQTVPVRLAPGAATLLATAPGEVWCEREASMAFAVLERDGEVVARNRLFAPLLRELRWPAAAVTVSLENGRAVFRSPVFAWGVCVDLNGEQPLADNFFDVYPGQETSLPWAGPQPPQIRFVGNLV